MKIYKLIGAFLLLLLMACTPKFIKTYQAKLIENAAKQIDIDRNIILKYAIENKLELQSTDSGIYYIFEKPGDNNHPDMNSQIIAHYRGTLMNGEKFDASYGGDPLNFRLGQVIKGWQECIPLLGKGGKGKFFVPSHLAYGKSARGKAIPANSVLIFEIELLDFE